jgi:ABC-2 type transport system ATP-binding protein
MSYHAPQGNRVTGQGISQVTGAETSAATAGDAGRDGASADDREIPALAVEGLSHSFGKRKALDDVGFTIEPGEFTVLLGQNGAGKTTLFSLITRLYNNRSGSIRVYGYDVRATPSEALARIGAVFQQRTLDLDLTIRQNLRYHAALHGMARAESDQRIETELKRFELYDRLDDKVRQLSGGQLRRVEIARSLIHRPKLLLLDEATVGLDIGSRRNIVEHARQLVGDERLGMLWATHLIDEVGPGAKVVVLHLGQVKAVGPVEQVVEQAGASDIGEAFHKLTGSDVKAGAAA